MNDEIISEGELSYIAEQLSMTVMDNPNSLVLTCSSQNTADQLFRETCNRFNVNPKLAEKIQIIQCTGDRIEELMQREQYKSIVESNPHILVGLLSAALVDMNEGRDITQSLKKIFDQSTIYAIEDIIQEIKKGTREPLFLVNDLRKVIETAKKHKFGTSLLPRNITRLLPENKLKTVWMAGSLQEEVKAIKTIGDDTLYTSTGIENDISGLQHRTIYSFL